MSKGVFNPYKAPEKPKKNFHSPTGDDPYDTEYGQKSKGNIKLDGNSYILELIDLDIEDVPERLGTLLADVIKHHPTHMIQYGINLMPKEATLILDDDEMSLPTSKGHISVYFNKEKNETEVFRRIAHALHLLPIKEILAKHKAKIVVRS